MWNFRPSAVCLCSVLREMSTSLSMERQLLKAVSVCCRLGAIPAAVRR